MKTIVSLALAGLMSISALLPALAAQGSGKRIHRRKLQYFGKHGAGMEQRIQFRQHRLMEYCAESPCSNAVG